MNSCIANRCMSKASLLKIKCYSTTKLIISRQCKLGFLHFCEIYPCLSQLFKFICISYLIEDNLLSEFHDCIYYELSFFNGK